jgi:hypothetical protein
MNWINRMSRNENGDEEKNYSFARWMSWLFLVASITLLIFVYYRAEIIFQGTMDDRYFKYYLISLAAILFWGVVLRLREEIQANIVTVVSSLVVGLYLVEGGLTFLGLGQPGYRAEAESATKAKIAAELGIEWDKRSKLEVIEDLIAEGVDAVPAIWPLHVLQMSDNFLPLGGIAYRTTVGSNETGRWAIYPSDRYGFNNPDSEWDATKLEWLLIGDSYTEGEAVQPGEDIAGQLRAITHQSAISLGRGGNGPLTELAELTEYAGAIKPNKVLWIYYEGNDLISKRSNQINDLQRDKMNPLLMQYMEEGFSQNLINRQQEINSRLEKYIAIAQVQGWKNISAQAQAQQYKTRWMKLYAIRSVVGFDAYMDVDVDYPLFAKILTKAKAGVESRGGKLYFVYLPELGRYNKVVSHDKFRKKSEVIDLVKGLDIPVIDTHQEIFANHPDPLALFPYRGGGHYNAEGYSEVAKAIVENIRD